jgi:MFS family permease
MMSGHSVETRASWLVAFAILALFSVTYGAPLVLVVALKPIAADLDAPRSVPALAAALASFGTGIGGIPMGWLAERIGVRRITIFGAMMAALGLAISTFGGHWGLYIGYGLFVGLLGNSCLNAPLMTYVSRWFDRRRGTALALVTSGQYIAGTIWPILFELGIQWWGWKQTAITFAIIEAVAVLPLAIIFLHAPPRPPVHGSYGAGPMPGGRVLGLHPNLVMGLMSFAIFLCCIPMALPSVHLVAFCTDLGLTASTGAGMLSVLLACAFLSRQFWGWVADRVGGLRTVLASSACQCVALALFLATQSEIGLYAVAAAFGLGFSGLVPSYVLAVRDHFPSSEAGWRVPMVMFGGLLGMAAGGWLGGVVYDAAGSYVPAFQLGVLSNIVNLMLVGFLVSRMRRDRVRLAIA